MATPITPVKKKLRIGIVVGTRPEIIKMAPIIKACEASKVPYVLIHTGQHYSPELDSVFFENLSLSAPAYNLHVGSGNHPEMIARMLEGMTHILEKERLTIMLVQGDTNSAFAGALAAHKSGIPVGHVEAGLRSYDRSMPEEINRVLIDHLSDVLYAPTSLARDLLRKENIPHKRIQVVGNTIVDAVLQNMPDTSVQNDVLEKLGVMDKSYAILTLHRPGNVDDAKYLESLLAASAKSCALPLLFIAHPRTRAQLAKKRIHLPKNIRLIDSVGYFDMLSLVAHARLVLTDSGGLQEEAAVLGTPCVTLRPNTERPETITAGSNVLAPTLASIPGSIKKALLLKSWKQPFGKGNATVLILEHLRATYG